MKPIPLALILTSLSLLAAPIATSQTFWMGLGEIFVDLYQQSQIYLDQTISQEFGEMAPLLQSAINQSLGALGISDPRVVRSGIEEGVIRLEQFDLSQPPPLIQSQELTKALGRERARAHVASVIGQSGQQALQERLAQVGFTLEETQALGDAAMSAISTQEAIKHIAQQNVQATSLIGALQMETLNSRIDNQFQLEALANLSQSLDEERRSRLNRELARATASFTHAAQARLF